MTTRTLFLNANSEPYSVLPFEDAINKVLDREVEVVVAYADKFVRSARLCLEWPAVIRSFVMMPTGRKVHFSRRNLLARDGYTCGYCGRRPKDKAGRPLLEELEVEHVIPRSQAVNGLVKLAGGRTVAITSWPNVVTACTACNARKKNRTPAQAGMKLLWTPKAPNGLSRVRIAMVRTEIPDEWKKFLPRESPWADYWDVELDPG